MLNFLINILIRRIGKAGKARGVFSLVYFRDTAWQDMYTHAFQYCMFVKVANVLIDDGECRGSDFKYEKVGVETCCPIAVHEL